MECATGAFRCNLDFSPTVARVSASLTSPPAAIKGRSMGEYRTEDRTARVCGIIGAVAMCTAAAVPIALVAGVKHAPAHRGEDPTLIKSVLGSGSVRAPAITWVGIRR
jgi:hypothetical protein